MSLQTSPLSRLHCCASIDHARRLSQNNSVQLDTFIQWTIRHNALIIEGLIALIVLFVLFLAYRTFLLARNEEKNPKFSGGADLGHIEETLKKILEQASALPAVGSAAAGNNGALLSEIAELRQSLETKQAELELAQAAGANSAVAVPAADGDNSALMAQIQELQGKLSEYEIISEDIADLSFYKEENVKLQKELEFLKSSAPAVAVVTAATKTEVAPVQSDSLLAEISTAVTSVEPKAVDSPASVKPAAAVSDVPPMAAPLAETSAAEPAASIVDDDIMAEFAAAISEQLTAKEGPAVAATAPTTEPSASATAESPAVTEDKDETLGSLDLDRMQSEATNLLEDAPAEDSENPLESELDPSKLMAEAASMEPEKVKNDAKLMDEFENFVKKDS